MAAISSDQKTVQMNTSALSSGKFYFEVTAYKPTEFKLLTNKDSSNTSVYGYSSNQLAKDDWSHFTFTADTVSKSARVYLNGIKQVEINGEMYPEIDVYEALRLLEERRKERVLIETNPSLKKAWKTFEALKRLSQ